MAGRITCQNRRRVLAPSTLAASIRSSGTACRADKVISA